MPEFEPGAIFNNDKYSGREWFHRADKALTDMENQLEDGVAVGEIPREVVDALYLLIDNMIDGTIRPATRETHKRLGVEAREGLKQVHKVLHDRLEELKEEKGESF